MKLTRAEKEKRTREEKALYALPEDDLMVRIYAIRKRLKKQPKHLMFQNFMAELKETDLQELILQGTQLYSKESVSVDHIGLLTSIQMLLHGDDEPILQPGQDSRVIFDLLTHLLIYEFVRRRGCFAEFMFASDPFDLVNTGQRVTLSGPNLEAIRETRSELESEGVPVPVQLIEDSPEFARLLGLGGKPSGISFER